MFEKITALLTQNRKSTYGLTLVDLDEGLSSKIPSPVARQHQFLLRELVTGNGKNILYVAIREGQSPEYTQKLNKIFGETGFRKQILGDAFDLPLEVVYEAYPTQQIKSYLDQLHPADEHLVAPQQKVSKPPIPRETAEIYRLLITGLVGFELQVAYCDNQGLSFFQLSMGQNAFKQAVCKSFQIDPHHSDRLTFQGTRIDSEEFKRKFDAMYPQSAASFDHSPFRQKADKAQSKLRYLEEDTQFDSEGRETEIDEILNAIFVPAFQQGAQDVKLRYDFSKKAVSIEYIIDDVQVFPPSYPASRQLFSMLMNRLMLRARIDDPVSLNVRRGEIVFQFNDSQGRRQIFTGRVLIMPRVNPDAPLEERNRDFYATVRLLRVSGERLTINQLGLYPHELEAFKFARRQKSGLILICGQTGSGKNITITANLEQYVLENGGSVRGISLERPIEGTIHGFDQIAVTGDLVKIGGVEVLRDGPYYLSGAMQASPRVLYINEINDAQTARLAIIAEQTGNLIWSTVHAKNPFAVIDRLRGLEVSSDFVAGSLLMIVHQVLSRKICEMCKVPDLDWRKRILNCEQAPNLVYFPEAIRHWCSTESNPNPSDADVDRIFRPYRGSGLLPNGHSCPNCQRKTADGIVSTGVTGRTLIPEIWLTGSQQSQIIEGVPSTTLRRTAIRRGHNTLWFNALRRIIDGIISIDSAAEACEAIDLYKEGIGDFDPHDDRVAGPNTHNSPRIVRVTVQSTGNPGTPARQLPQ